MNFNHKNRHELKNAVFEMRLFYNRALIAFLLVLVAFTGLLYRAFNLQVSNFQNFATESDRNRIKLLPEAPVRGMIYDRNGVILADNRSVYSLVLIPEKVTNINAALVKIKMLLNISVDKISEFRKRLKGERRFESVTLLNKVNEKQRAIFEVNRHNFPGFSIEARLVRYYPLGKDFVHIVGYVGRISKNELNAIDEKNYRGTRNIGKIGLEKYYEAKLHGTVGYKEVERDVHRRVIKVLKRTPPTPGADLRLSVDSQLQILATKELGKHRGSIVAVDPNNGEILAMVSNPGYDPNPFVVGISSKAFKKLNTSKDKPFLNRAINGQYPPGSTIKPMLGLAGLEQNIITAKTVIFDPGWFMIDNDDRKYRDWTLKVYGRGHGKVNLFKAIQQSCDTFFYRLAYKMGIDKIHKAMSAFSFGELTGIDLIGEKKALLPSRKWKRNKLKEPWFPGETVIVGIGQGFWTVTPLQLANATAILANKGIRYKLHLLKAIDYGLGYIENPPIKTKQQVDASAENMEQIRIAMKAVNHSGTARKAFRKAPFSSAGKTGTAQLISIAQDEEYDKDKVDYRERDNAMYIGFAPYDKPKIAISVVVENEGHGGSTAAPMAKKLMQYWLNKGNHDG